MASEHKRDKDDSGFTFGVSELLNAEAAQPPSMPRRAPAPRSQIVAAVKFGRDSLGNDPYNTSGSFDRSRNWSRVGKR